MISVCVTTFNSEKYIQAQLDSILSQLGEEDEVIVSDNLSTDSTIETIENIKDRRIRIVYCEIKSPVWNFENALKEAKGDYIFLADHDDIWKPEKVSVCMKWLKEYGCVISDATMIDNDLNVKEESYFKAHGTHFETLFNTVIKNGYMGCCMAFTRETLDKALPFPENIPLHDIWIGNIAAYFTSKKFIDDKLVLYRCHGENLSFTANLMSGNSLWKKFQLRYSLVKELLKRTFKK